MPVKPKNDTPLVWPDEESSRSGSESDQSSDNANYRHRITYEKRGDKWHKKYASSRHEVTAPLDKDGSGNTSLPKHGNRKNHSHSQVNHLPPRPERTKAANAECLVPEPCLPTAGAGKQNAYPPIVTIDGRVDTDLDHLIDEDEIEDDQNYDGPVDEIPSRFPKPHVFSVIHGSLDDDVDSYANDDGTMEHTLVDAPKNFHPRDLKDVAATDAAGAKARSSQMKNGRDRRGNGGGGSQLMNYSDRSHNKMHTDGERSDPIGNGKEKLQEQREQRRQPNMASHIEPRTFARLGPDSQRQFYSDESIQHEQGEPAAPTCVLSDTFTVTHHREEPGMAKHSNWIPQISDAAVKSSGICGLNQKKQRSMEQSINGQGTLDEVGLENRKILKQPSPGKSVSEQTQRSADSERAKGLRRVLSGTPKLTKTLCRSKVSLVHSSPRRSATRSLQNEEIPTDSNDDEYTFITCREPSCQTATIDQQQSEDCKITPDKKTRQPMSNFRRKRPGHTNTREIGGDELASDISSVSEFDSMDDISVDNSLSGDIEPNKDSSPDYFLADKSHHLFKAAVSKSDTGASIKATPASTKYDVPSSRHTRPIMKTCLKGTDACEWYKDSVANKKHIKTRASNDNVKAENDQENCNYFDAKESHSKETFPHFKEQKRLATSKMKNEDNYYSDILRHRQASYERHIPNEDQWELCGRRNRLIFGSTTSPSGKEKRRPLEYIHRAHGGNTISYGTEGFRPVYHPQGNKSCSEENKGHHNKQRGSQSPTHVRRNVDLAKQKGTYKSDGKQEGARGSGISPIRLDRRRQGDPFSSIEKSSHGASERDSFLPDRKGKKFLSSPKTWHDVTDFSRHAFFKEPSLKNRRDRDTRRSGERRRSVRSKEYRREYRKAPRASWSFDSDHSPIAYRNASRMMPYPRRKAGESDREVIARILGSSVDGVSPFDGFNHRAEHKKRANIKPLTDKELKDSLQRAMTIARESLHAAARVSKALNLVMTNSCSSIESRSFYGSSNNPLSPRYRQEPTPSQQVLMWNQTQGNSSVSSRYTEVTAAPLHQTLTLNPSSEGSCMRKSPKREFTSEEASLIGRSNDLLVHSNSRQSRSIFVGGDRLLRIVPNYNIKANRGDDIDSSTPLVSIYIGGPGPQQQQVARIFSSQLHQEYSQIPNSKGSHNFLPKSSSELAQLTSFEDQGNIACNQKSQLEADENLPDKGKCELLSYTPVQNQSVCVNMVTTTGIQHEQIQAPKQCDTSNSQIFESTLESLGEEIKDRKKETCSLGFNSFEKGLSQSKVKSHTIRHAQDELHDVPTHEDGSQRLEKHYPETDEFFSQPATDIDAFGMETADLTPAYPEKLLPTKRGAFITSPSKASIAEPSKLFTDLDCLVPPESRSVMMSAALDYLAAYPDCFSVLSPSFDALSPSAEHIFLHPDRINPPSYDMDAVKAKGEESNCILSPGSCVDPTGYHTLGTAVDPPRRKNTRDKNTNLSHSQPFNFDATDDENFMAENPVCTDTAKSCLENKMKMTNNSIRVDESEHLVRYVPFHGKGCINTSEYKKQESSKKLETYINKSFIEKQPNDTSVTARTIQGCLKHSKKTTKRVKPCKKKAPYENCNNNSSGDGKVPILQLQAKGNRDSDTKTGAGNGIDDTLPESMSDKNQNQPLSQRSAYPDRRQALSEALRILSTIQDSSGIEESHGDFKKIRTRSNRSRDRVKRSLSVAVKLAKQSLSAAARVTDLLNQVVDLYQYRQLVVSDKLTQSVMQQRAKANAELIARCPHRALGVSQIEAIECIGDSKRKRELYCEDYPKYFANLPEPARRYFESDSETEESIILMSSPKCRRARETRFRHDRHREEEMLSPRDEELQPRFENSETRSRNIERAEIIRKYHRRRSSSSKNLVAERNDLLDKHGEVKAAEGTLKDDFVKGDEFIAHRKKHGKYKYVTCMHSEECMNRELITKCCSSKSESKRCEKIDCKPIRKNKEDSQERRRRPSSQHVRKLDGQEKEEDSEFEFQNLSDVKNRHKKPQKGKDAQKIKECYDDKSIHSEIKTAKQKHNSRKIQVKGESIENTHKNPIAQNKKQEKNTDDIIMQSSKNTKIKAAEGNHRKGKTRADSPGKIEQQQRIDIENKGSSVDSPILTKGKNVIEIIDNPGSKTRKTDGRSYANNAAQRAEKKRRHRTHRNSGQKVAEEKLDDQFCDTKAEGIGFTKKKSKNLENGWPCSPQEEASHSKEKESRISHKRNKKLKSKHKSENSRSVRAEDRSKSNSVDPPTLFTSLVAAAASVSLPVNQLSERAEGENCSFNRSLELNGSFAQNQCFPVKHRYPSPSYQVRKVQKNHVPSDSQPSSQKTCCLPLKTVGRNDGSMLNAWSESNIDDSIWLNHPHGMEDDLKGSLPKDENQSEGLDQTTDCPAIMLDICECEDDARIIMQKNGLTGGECNASAAKQTSISHNEHCHSSIVDDSLSSSSPLRVRYHQDKSVKPYQGCKKGAFVSDSKRKIVKHCFEVVEDKPFCEAEVPSDIHANNPSWMNSFSHEGNGGCRKAKSDEWQRSYSTNSESSSLNTTSSEEAEEDAQDTEDSSLSSSARSDNYKVQNYCPSDTRSSIRYQTISRDPSGLEKAEHTRGVYASLQRENSFYSNDLQCSTPSLPGASSSYDMKKPREISQSTREASFSSEVDSTPEEPHNLSMSIERGDECPPHHGDTRYVPLSNFLSKDQTKYPPHARHMQGGALQRLDISSGDSLQSYTVSASITGTDGECNVSNCENTPPFTGLNALSYQNENFPRGSGHDETGPRSKEQVPSLSASGNRFAGSGETESGAASHALQPSKTAGAAAEAAEAPAQQKGCNGRGLYSLYRPLDNIRSGINFSPIMEESQISGLSMAERRSSSSMYVNKRAVELSNSNNCNTDIYQLELSDMLTSPAYSSHINFHKELIEQNLNNNSSFPHVAEDAPSSKDLEFAAYLPQLETLRKNRIACRSKPHEADPFGHLNRLPLPPLEQPQVYKLTPLVRKLSDQQQWRQEKENTKLCRRIVNVGKRGCTFDTGLTKPRKKTLSTKTTSRLSEQESIARHNERLFRRIMAKESVYKREDLLKDYDNISTRSVYSAKYIIVKGVYINC
ncbi:hypothetical protein PoB_002035400 [Plakobranchus ocellatus]|uniref:Uncharacterized protein n=1 Tax=Plakobranchus ocellatus TaxID=259542 RepID=A0AAV3ZIY9_9GAST|nr:hypothetical protein PoB_002035400 [Plakobranchus ocellatus]